MEQQGSRKETLAELVGLEIQSLNQAPTKPSAVKRVGLEQGEIVSPRLSETRNDKSDKIFRNNRESGVPLSVEHAERLEQVREQIQDLKTIAECARQLTVRLSELAAQQKPDLPAEVAKIWANASSQIARYLNQPVQIGAGATPHSLEEAQEQFEHWISLFCENAAGPDGTGLQDDPDRLRSFQGKLENIEPLASTLAKNGRALVAQKELTLEYLQASAQETYAKAHKNTERLKAIDQAARPLQAHWLEALQQEKRELEQLKADLKKISGEHQLSATLLAKTDEGIQILNHLSTEPLEQAQISIAEWVGKFREAEDFTAEKVRERIQTDLKTPFQKLAGRIEELRRAYDPDRLKKIYEAELKKERGVVIEEAQNLLGALKARTSVLTNLRREKLGSKPDVRFFGEIAKQVNTAITALSEAEMSLLEAISALKDAPLVSKNAASFTESQAKAKKLLIQTQNFAARNKIEELLATSWKTSLTPLKEVLETARKREISAKALADKYSRHPGFDTALAADLKIKTQALTTACARATEFITDHEKQSGGAKELTAQRERLMQTIQAAAQALEPYTDETRLMAKLEANKERTEERRVEEERQAREEEARRRSTLLPRLVTLTHEASHLASQFRRALGYATQLEQYDSSRALELYQKLTALAETNFNSQVSALPPLGEIISQGKFLTELKTRFESAEHSTNEIEIEISQIEVALGENGRASELFREFNDLENRYPLTAYRTRGQLSHLLTVRVDQFEQKLFRRRTPELDIFREEVVWLREEIERFQNEPPQKATERGAKLEARLKALGERLASLEERTENEFVEREAVSTQENRALRMKLQALLRDQSDYQSYPIKIDQEANHPQPQVSQDASETIRIHR
ncbi:hypothetical protein HYW32_02430 [Candidatus Berkelbacteria bacterium]|nr:hypothetical protein [Candidatus Berkelbacteria bacterium]